MHGHHDPAFQEDPFISPFSAFYNLHPADLACIQSYLYAVRMKGASGEDVLYNPRGGRAGALILFFNDLYLHAGADVRSVLSVH